MRTPDSEDTQGSEPQGTETQSGEASLLADGFGGGDSAFGAGSPDGEGDVAGDATGFDEAFASQDPSFLQGDASGGTEFGDSAGDSEFGDSAGGTEFGDSAGDEMSAFELEPDYVPDTDTDWDVTGDGVVDHHDAHEAMTGFGDFQVDDADSHGHAQNEGFFHTE
jgi:hypothetical protein